MACLSCRPASPEKERAFQLKRLGLAVGALRLSCYVSAHGMIGIMNAAVSSQDLPLNPSLTSPAPHHKIRRRKSVNTSERRGDGGDVSQPLPENSDLVMLDTRTGWPTGPTNRPLTALVLNGLPVLPAGLAGKKRAFHATQPGEAEQTF